MTTELKIRDLLSELLASQSPDTSPVTPGQRNAIVTKVRQHLERYLDTTAQSLWPLENPASGEVWLPLNEYRPQPTDSPPSELRIGPFIALTNGKRNSPAWYQIPLLTAKWLHQEGLLTEDQLPITLSRRGRPAIAAQPPDRSVTHEVAPGIQMVTQLGYDKLIEHARLLLIHFGVDPIRCEVKCAPGAAGTDQPRLIN